MKEILFIRHAKSDWSFEGLSDFNRPLNPRGKKNAPEMGKRLLNLGWRPDQVWLSSSARTRETMRLLSDSANWTDIAHREESSLYHGGYETYLGIVNQLNDSISRVVICGHNPTTTMIINLLSGENSGNVPTCGMGLIRFELDSWKLISVDTGKLVHYDFPKNQSSESRKL